MRTLYESLLSDIDTALNNGTNMVSNMEQLNIITKDPEAFYEFVFTHLKNKYKKYKVPINRSRKGLRHYDNTIRTLKIFDPNKKYFLISTINDGSIKRINMFVNINDEVSRTCLSSFKAYHFNNTNTVDLHTFGPNPNYTVSKFIESGTIDAVYEVPKDFEWLYYYIKNCGWK